MDGDSSRNVCQGPIRGHATEARWIADASRDIWRTADASHPRRGELERFIAARYQQAYAATLSEFMPMLVALSDGSGQIVAAAGFRCAAQGPLFLEQYLDQPLEALLSAAYDAVVPRSALVEIGHLSGMGYGGGRALFPRIARHLQHAGLDWAAFVATRSLRGLFARMGVAPRSLAAARAERLGLRARDWGRYYDTDPWVVGGPLSLGAGWLQP